MASEVNLEREINHRFVKSFADMLFLTALKKPMSGYDIMRHTYERFHVLLSPGTVYPRLRALEKDGLIKRNVTDKCRIYTLTEKGAHLVETPSMRNFVRISEQMLYDLP